MRSVAGKMMEINDLDVKVSLINWLIPTGLEHVNELLQEDVLQISTKKLLVPPLQFEEDYYRLGRKKRP